MDLRTRTVCRIAALGVVAVLALGIAAGSEDASVHGFALIAAVIAVVAAFRCIKVYFDAREGGAARVLPPLASLTPVRFATRLTAGTGAGAVALFGLTLAAGRTAGSFGYDLGLLLVVAAVVYIFLLIKHAFDRREA